jgi:site-specific DNA recombinase
VRRIFKLYLEAGSARRLKERLDELGVLTGIRARRDGTSSGGKLFARGHLYWLLSNPIYAGDVRHREKIAKGQHQAIVGREQWDAVQQQIKQQTASRRMPIAVPPRGASFAVCSMTKPAIG